MKTTTVIETILDKKVEELISQGNKNIYHFIDLPNGEVYNLFRYSPEYVYYDPSSLPDILNVVTTVSYNGYTFLIRNKEIIEMGKK